MSAHPTLQATLPQALENAVLTAEYLRGSLQFASPVEAIVVMGLLTDASALMHRIEELAGAIRMEHHAPVTTQYEYKHTESGQLHWSHEDDSTHFFRQTGRTRELSVIPGSEG